MYVQADRQDDSYYIPHTPNTLFVGELFDIVSSLLPLFLLVLIPVIFNRKTKQTNINTMYNTIIAIWMSKNQTAP